MTRHVAIVGAGYSGTLLAVELARRGQRVTLIERAPVAGLGVAYGTDDPRHLLNVRAAGMSALADDPGHFVRWLEAQGVTDAATTFAPRREFGAYVRALLAEAGPAVAVRSGEVVAIDTAEVVRVTLADGSAIIADTAVLAIGNLPPGVPAGVEGITGSPRYLADPWAGSLTADLGADDAVLLVGTGLTMIDAAITLSEGFAGRIVALSRRGQVPMAHAAPAPVSSPPPPLDAAPAGSLSARVAQVRRRGEAIGWRAAIDELRPLTQRAWAEADLANRARFLRHLRPWWDVHRHRIAPEIAARIADLRESGRLTILAAKLLGATDTDAGIAVEWRARGTNQVERAIFQRVVNCTGPLQNVARSGEPLLDRLIERGMIRPDALRIGIDVDADGRTIGHDGSISDRLRAVGPMTKGAWWEIVAVPDLRRQVADMAEALSAD